jgi:hypothetical protein
MFASEMKYILWVNQLAPSVFTLLKGKAWLFNIRFKIRKLVLFIIRTLCLPVTSVTVKTLLN